MNFLAIVVESIPGRNRNWIQKLWIRPSLLCKCAQSVTLLSLLYEYNTEILLLGVYCSELLTYVSGFWSPCFVLDMKVHVVKIKQLLFNKSWCPKAAKLVCFTRVLILHYFNHFWMGVTMSNTLQHHRHGDMINQN